MITRIYTWFYTLKIASATNATQPLASKKKKKKQKQQHYFKSIFEILLKWY